MPPPRDNDPYDRPPSGLSFAGGRRIDAENMVTAKASPSKRAGISANGSAILGSWKEVAAYLGKGVRTVERWEQELGLPVRRPVAHNRRIVIAVPAELDSWVQQQVTRNSAAHQVRVIEDSTLRAQMATLTETLQHLDNTIRHLHLNTEEIKQERRHGRELRAALKHTRSSLEALRQT